MMVLDLALAKLKDRVVLVVDDEVGLLDILALEFEDHDCTVLRATTGEQASALLNSRFSEIDLLVTDIRLPGQMDGWDVALEAKRLRPDMPVIYVTGFFSEASRQVTDGVVMMKPYRPSAIVATAVRLLGGVSDQNVY